ncbi:ABC transporter transmembrane domain-containing protein [Rudaeicoccus suwonensis]|uniref:ABC-type multidrug transport system fused ATPase/permease subunit n=1 Tax=Rudaeicoccus suwonensis TaxID=657409 RepID=A0A561E8G7_9MICO|nr:ABC transporter ATP-binding protein [Rudaeicoccus suwonensis]TWE11909.1 ABC-type multidrug transport system fused ATPase/permease subunit [Rudaeicoccus suwonensis]
MQPLPYADPGTPDLRGPWRFLLWIARGQWRSQCGGVVYGVIWMLSQALVPAALAAAIDQGIRRHDTGSLVLWSGVILALAAIAALAGMMRHRYAVENWLRSAYRVIQLIGHKAADTGAALPRAMPTGKVVATVASDAMQVGAAYDTFGRFAAAIVSYAVVAVILLLASVQLGLVVLIGVPVLLAVLGFVLRPLQRRQAAQREEGGKLTELGADTVGGLRVLRGIGGEQTFLRRYVAQSGRVRQSGYDVAGLQSTLDAAQVLLPGIFMVIVTWLGARAVFAGSISAGELVAFYGYAAFLVMPLRTATEMTDKFTRALVAARKVIAVLEVQPDSADRGTRELPVTPSELHDSQSGVSIRPGCMTAVVSGSPADSAALADRLGRFGSEESAVTLGGVPLSQAPLEQVRSRIVVSETDPRLFTGTLRAEVDPSGAASDRELLAALEVASAADVLEALPDGLDSQVEERGRSFSGGQRQRLALARALLVALGSGTADPTLILVEPTSAVDAHTEARIAARLADARRGATTVVMTASPLLLDHADEVVFLADGRQAARGTHMQLMADDAAYRRVVVRGED